jgi:RNA methyltransferase, TrmH family
MKRPTIGLHEGKRSLRRIDSPDNPYFKTWLALLDGRGVRKRGMFLLSGIKTVPEALRRWPDRFRFLLTADPAWLEAMTLPTGVEAVTLAPALFRALDPFGVNRPLLVGTTPPIPALDLQAPPQGLELVCALGDPANLGACLRSAAAFGVSRVILLDEAAHPFHPKSLRAASNAVFCLELHRGGGWATITEAAGPLLVLDGGGQPMDDFTWPAHARLILGEEGQGVPAALPGLRLSIPAAAVVESLNAVVAASIAMHHHYQRHQCHVRS